MDMMNTLELSPEKRKYLKSITGTKYVGSTIEDVTILDIINWLPENILNQKSGNYDTLCIEKYENDFFKVCYKNYNGIPTIKFSGMSLIDVLFDMLIWYYTNHEKSN